MQSRSRSILIVCGALSVVLSSPWLSCNESCAQVADGVNPDASKSLESPPLANPENASTGPTVQDSIERARMEAYNKNYSEARQILKRALNAEPKNLQLLMEYYPITVKTNDWSDGVQVLERIFEISPEKEKDFYFDYADGLLKMRRLDKAQVAFLKAINFGKNKEMAYKKLMEIAKQKKDESGLETAYQEYLKLKPKDGDIHFEYADLLYRNKRVTEAMTHYKQASENKPYDAYMHERFAYILLFEKDFDGSVAEYKKAIQTTPRDKRSRLEAALKYARSKQAPATTPPAPATKK